MSKELDIATTLFTFLIFIVIAIVVLQLFGKELFGLDSDAGLSSLRIVNGTITVKCISGTQGSGDQQFRLQIVADKLQFGVGVSEEAKAVIPVFIFKGNAIASQVDAFDLNEDTGVKDFSTPDFDTITSFSSSEEYIVVTLTSNEQCRTAARSTLAAPNLDEFLKQCGESLIATASARAKIDAACGSLPPPGALPSVWRLEGEASDGELHVTLSGFEISAKLFGANPAEGGQNAAYKIRLTNRDGNNPLEGSVSCQSHSSGYSVTRPGIEDRCTINTDDDPTVDVSDDLSLKITSIDTVAKTARITLDHLWEKEWKINDRSLWQYQGTSSQTSIAGVWFRARILSKQLSSDGDAAKHQFIINIQTIVQRQDGGWRNADCLYAPFIDNPDMKRGETASCTSADGKRFTLSFDSIDPLSKTIILSVRPR